jgi:hypothetical protein
MLFLYILEADNFTQCCGSRGFIITSSRMRIRILTKYQRSKNISGKTSIRYSIIFNNSQWASPDPDPSSGYEYADPDQKKIFTDPQYRTGLTGSMRSDGFFNHRYLIPVPHGNWQLKKRQQNQTSGSCKRRVNTEEKNGMFEPPHLDLNGLPGDHGPDCAL